MTREAMESAAPAAAPAGALRLLMLHSQVPATKAPEASAARSSARPSATSSAPRDSRARRWAGVMRAVWTPLAREQSGDRWIVAIAPGPPSRAKARVTDVDTRGDATLEVRDGERPRPRRDRRRTAMSARRGRISGR